MDARPVLATVARVLREQRLEAILIGNAAAALGAVVFTPHYPVSGLLRLIRDEDAMQLDFMTAAHGIRSFNSLRSRATEVEFEGERMAVAALADVTASRRAANRPRDRAVLDVLERTIDALEKTLKQEEAGQPGRNPRRSDT